MAVPLAQAEVAAFLGRLAGAAPVETHISAVFIGADTVWKLKKAVRLPFLDFSDTGARRRFCLRELELNAPAAPGLYRDVAPVVRGPDGALRFGGEHEAAGAIDWVLRMARIPAGDFLDEIVQRDGLDAGLLDALADMVAAYHRGLPPLAGVDHVAAMRWVTCGNVASALAAGLDRATVETWREAILNQLDRLAGWLERRAREGFVRRAHGDLHLGNLCLWHAGPAPFDALEFDEKLAMIDLGYDFAFLLMDVIRRAGRPAANRLLNRYIARTGDADLLHGLAVFLSLRALIRAHVERSRANAELAEECLRAALEYLRPSRPLIIAVGGLQGTGKSTLARGLAPALGPAPGALVVRSDEIRKRLHGVAPEEKLPPSAYAEAVSARVFAELCAQARIAVQAGRAVVADATFLDPAHRAALLAVAEQEGMPFLGLWLHAPLEALQARIAARRAAPLADASDATEAVLLASAAAAALPRGWRAIPALDAEATLAAAREAAISVSASC